MAHSRFPSSASRQSDPAETANHDPAFADNVHIARFEKVDLGTIRTTVGFGVEPELRPELVEAAAQTQDVDGMFSIYIANSPVAKKGHRKARLYAVGPWDFSAAVAGGRGTSPTAASPASLVSSMLSTASSPASAGASPASAAAGPTVCCCHQYHFGLRPAGDQRELVLAERTVDMNPSTWAKAFPDTEFSPQIALFHGTRRELVIELAKLVPDRLRPVTDDSWYEWTRIGYVETLLDVLDGTIGSRTPGPAAADAAADAGSGSSRPSQEQVKYIVIPPPAALPLSQNLALRLFHRAVARSLRFAARYRHPRRVPAAQRQSRVAPAAGKAAGGTADPSPAPQAQSQPGPETPYGFTVDAVDARVLIRDRMLPTIRSSLEPSPRQRDRIRVSTGF